MMPCLSGTVRRKSCRLVQLECPTIRNTRMPRGSSAIFAVIRGRERTGGSLILLGRSHAGFFGISRPFGIPWRILRGASTCEQFSTASTCEQFSTASTYEQFSTASTCEQFSTASTYEQFSTASTYKPLQYMRSCLEMFRQT